MHFNFLRSFYYNIVILKKQVIRKFLSFFQFSCQTYLCFFSMLYLENSSILVNVFPFFGKSFNRLSQTSKKFRFLVFAPCSIACVHLCFCLNSVKKAENPKVLCSFRPRFRALYQMLFAVLYAVRIALAISAVRSPEQSPA